MGPSKLKGGLPMDIEGYSYPEGLYYHKEHFWAKVEGAWSQLAPLTSPKNRQARSFSWNYPLPARRSSRGNPAGRWSQEMGGKDLYSGFWKGRIGSTRNWRTLQSW